MANKSHLSAHKGKIPPSLFIRCKNPEWLQGTEDIRAVLSPAFYEKYFWQFSKPLCIESLNRPTLTDRFDFIDLREQKQQNKDRKKKGKKIGILPRDKTEHSWKRTMWTKNYCENTTLSGHAPNAHSALRSELAFYSPEFTFGVFTRRNCCTMSLGEFQSKMSIVPYSLNRADHFRGALRCVCVYLFVCLFLFICLFTKYYLDNIINLCLTIMMW